MENEFVPFELAVKLKDLGFTKNCFGTYCKNLTPLPESHSLWLNSDKWMSSYDMCEPICEAPLWQQVFDWFREKHNLHAVVYRIDGDISAWDWTINNSPDDDFNTELIETFPEARQACLEKLIEIVN